MRAGVVAKRRLKTSRERYRHSEKEIQFKQAQRMRCIYSPSDTFLRNAKMNKMHL